MAPLKANGGTKNIAWYRVEKVKSYQKRGTWTAVGEQNELQAQEISYHCDFKTGMNSAICFGKCLSAQATCMKNGSLSAMGRSGSETDRASLPAAVQIVTGIMPVNICPRAEAAFGLAPNPIRLSSITHVACVKTDRQTHPCLSTTVKHVSAATAIHKAVTYFTNNKHRMTMHVFASRLLHQYLSAQANIHTLKQPARYKHPLTQHSLRPNLLKPLPSSYTLALPLTWLSSRLFQSLKLLLRLVT